MARKICTKILLLLFLLSACGGYTYQLRPPQGATAAQYQKDSAECASAGTGFVDLANEMNAVGTSTGDRDDAERSWMRCMESRGYERVRAPR